MRIGHSTAPRGTLYRILKVLVSKQLGLLAVLALVHPPWVTPLYAEIPPIVFVGRSFDAPPDATRETAVERASTAALIVRDANGTERMLVDGSTATTGVPRDISDPAVSWDAQRMVFSGLLMDGWINQRILADFRGRCRRNGLAADYDK